MVAQHHVLVEKYDLLMGGADRLTQSLEVGHAVHPEFAVQHAVGCIVPGVVIRHAAVLPFVVDIVIRSLVIRIRPFALSGGRGGQHERLGMIRPYDLLQHVNGGMVKIHGAAIGKQFVAAGPKGQRHMVAPRLGRLLGRCAAKLEKMSILRRSVGQPRR